MAISLKVNGATRSVDAEPDTPLLYVLRNDFELNGAKFGCGLAQCGTCTVLLNGASIRSCIVFAVQADGGEVSTVEGLAVGGELHPLQDEFSDKQGLQCGYCTPGMLMRAQEILAQIGRASCRERV